jgi:hypothetical protein
MATMLEEIADFLETASLLAPGSYKLAELPNEPDDMVVLYEVPGMAPAFVHGKIGAAYEYPRLQLVVRSKSFTAARTRIQTLYRALSDVTNMTIGGTWYMRIQPLQSPYQVPHDGNDRVVLLCNFQVSKESV